MGKSAVRKLGSTQVHAMQGYKIASDVNYYAVQPQSKLVQSIANKFCKSCHINKCYHNILIQEIFLYFMSNKKLLYNLFNLNKRNGHLKNYLKFLKSKLSIKTETSKQYVTYIIPNDVISAMKIKHQAVSL